MTENLVLPKSIPYNDTMAERPAPAQYVDDLYEGAIVAVKPAICPWGKSSPAQKDDLGFNVSLRALDAAEQPVGPVITYWLGIAASNPDVAGHQVSTDVPSGRKTSTYDDYLLKSREFIRAVKGTKALPAFPKAKEGGGHFDPDTGDTLTALEKKNLVKLITGETIRTMCKWYENPAELIGARVFFATKRKGNWARVSYVTGETRGKTPRNSDFTVE
jgi:hypothetical protein